MVLIGYFVPTIIAIFIVGFFAPLVGLVELISQLEGFIYE